MTRTWMREPFSMRSLVSLILLITAGLGAVSAVLNAGNTPTAFHSPTATYTGYFSASYTGVYHYVEAQPLCSKNFPPCWVPSEVVFYLTTENTTVRLVFYCGLDYCSSAQQLPFHDGDRIYVKGTLIQPSEWPTSKYQPTLQFNSDLYVFKYAAA
ncbi:MAG: hypothetical protein ABSC50_01855 [Candidatus Bathyarchaeia archaeon]